MNVQCLMTEVHLATGESKIEQTILAGANPTRPQCD